MLKGERESERMEATTDSITWRQSVQHRVFSDVIQILNWNPFLLKKKGAHKIFTASSTLDWKKWWTKNQKKRRSRWVGEARITSARLSGIRLRVDKICKRLGSRTFPLAPLSFLHTNLDFLDWRCALYTVLVSPPTTTLLTNANHVLLQTAHKLPQSSHPPPPPIAHGRHSFSSGRRKKFEINVLCVCVVLVSCSYCY